MLCSQTFPFLDQILESQAFPTEAAARRKSTLARKNHQAKAQQLRQGPPANRVLLLGRIHELALYRAEVLRDRGFEVQTSINKAETLTLIRTTKYDAVVLSYTLSSETVEELAEAVREHCPQCPLVVIAKTRQPDRKIAPDAVALADQGPKALVAALRRVLQRH
jgi:hypothetical protein